MKVKKEYIILALLIVALCLYLVLHKRDKTQYTLPPLPDVPISEISRIEISKPNETIVLKKREDKWMLSEEGYRADAAKVRDMLDTIGQLTLTVLVSESKSYERYDLQKEKKITVKAWAGDSLTREFDVGKTAPSYGHTFVKIAGDDKVYHARDDFRGRFDRSVEDLRDKWVLRFAESEIGWVEIKDGKGSLTAMRKEIPVEIKATEGGAAREGALPKAELSWQSPEGKAVDESKLKALLRTLSNLECAGYVYERKKTEFTEPIYTIHLKGEKDYALSIYPARDGNGKEYPGTSSENDSPFFLSEALAKKIMVPPEEILG